MGQRLQHGAFPMRRLLWRHLGLVVVLQGLLRRLLALLQLPDGQVDLRLRVQAVCNGLLVLFLGKDVVPPEQPNHILRGEESVHHIFLMEHVGTEDHIESSSLSVGILQVLEDVSRLARRVLGLVHVVLGQEELPHQVQASRLRLLVIQVVVNAASLADAGDACLGFGLLPLLHGLHLLLLLLGQLELRGHAGHSPQQAGACSAAQGRCLPGLALLLLE
mmetsp:Transcript_61319/g.146170  ORF Transcript_61319/g.146170 Transcript_61319/m.146170 type:complete len:219 (-) Transcript_61319:400-1056(-)